MALLSLVKQYDVVVIGGGMAGVTALIWLKRLGVNAILVEKRQCIGGQIHKVHNKIKDYPGFYGIRGADLIKQLEDQLIELKAEWRIGVEVTEIKVINERVHLFLRRESKMTTQEVWIESKYLILATGAEERKLSIPGEKEQLEKVGVLTTSKDLQLFKNKRVLIVGGGDRAVEGAYRIKEVAEKVTLIHRQSEFKARKEYMDPVLDDKRVDVKRNVELKEIKCVDNVKVQAILKHKQSNGDEMIEVDYVLIRIGVKPNNELIENLVECNGQQTLIDSDGRTSCPQIFAIGDVVNVPDYSSFSLCAGQGMSVAKKIWFLLQSYKHDK